MSTDSFERFVPSGFTSNEPPFAGDVYGLFFGNAAATPEQTQQILNMLQAVADQRQNVHIGPWQRDDHKFEMVQSVFDVTDLPALVITKPWAGVHVGQSWTWNNPYMLPKLPPRQERPAHVSIQGDALFNDVPALGDTVEKFILILQRGDHQRIKSILQQRHYEELAHMIGERALTVVKNLSVTFAVGPAKVTLGYDEKGGSVIVEPQPAQDKEVKQE